jgi:transposase
MSQKKKSRKQYSEEFKAEALKLAAKTSVASAAIELGLYESQLYSWRSARNKKASVSERENELAAENAKLKRQLAAQAEELEILKKAATYFAKNQS